MVTVVLVPCIEELQLSLSSQSDSCDNFSQMWKQWNITTCTIIREAFICQHRFIGFPCFQAMVTQTKNNSIIAVNSISKMKHLFICVAGSLSHLPCPYILFLAWVDWNVRFYPHTTKYLTLVQCAPVQVCSYGLYGLYHKQIYMTITSGLYLIKVLNETIKMTINVPILRNNFNFYEILRWTHYPIKYLSLVDGQYNGL